MDNAGNGIRDFKAFSLGPWPSKFELSNNVGNVGYGFNVLISANTQNAIDNAKITQKVFMVGATEDSKTGASTFFILDKTHQVDGKPEGVDRAVGLAAWADWREAKGQGGQNRATVDGPISGTGKSIANNTYKYASRLGFPFLEYTDIPGAVTSGKVPSDASVVQFRWTFVITATGEDEQTVTAVFLIAVSAKLTTTSSKGPVRPEWVLDKDWANGTWVYDKGALKGSLPYTWRG